jgi:hypothetical protein
MSATALRTLVARWREDPGGTYRAWFRIPDICEDIENQRAFGRFLHTCAWVAISLVGIGCGAPQDELEAETRGDAGTSESGADPDEESGAGPDADELSVSDGLIHHGHDIQPIWNKHCLGMCHTENWNISLVAGSAYDTLVGGASQQQDQLELVASGEPEFSYLWHKLVGTHLETGGEGERMPKGSIPLDDERLDLIRAWIEQGAEP